MEKTIRGTDFGALCNDGDMHGGGCATVCGRALSGLAEDHSHSMATYHKGKSGESKGGVLLDPVLYLAGLRVVLLHFDSLGDPAGEWDCAWRMAAAHVSHRAGLTIV